MQVMLNNRKTDSFGGTRHDIYGKKIYSHRILNELLHMTPYSI